MASFARRMKRKEVLKNKKAENKNNGIRKGNSNTPRNFCRNQLIDIRNRSLFSMMSKRGYQK